ncbi:23S rRNA (adenine(2503)-C(2))-methyltransferase RlmN [Propionimicrobium sp. PCR01-08-3]|uniref:23S rRNA (adenine(2503)-C(2))-methyltransferase RlmN n=1 Tax=Propionimicrobium sp. PCR01-08-3 TaxID=3052086 RepID=UPI00255CE507|nr:23S rRNA (adenine(2503)-C(2))-methyltransferase RlmN [Propionimicrobium sp. PCR01-08-3]WIY81590.1 23S rRNA (adenine(2503)-C(2))-methyltransferase RlmN [Propionimicrobium sp. PCR01-08-3]
MTTIVGHLDLTGKFRPTRRKPPIHWMDLSPTDRVDAVKQAGLPGFRAKQISHQWFASLNADPAQWTDLPAGIRDQVAETWFPTMLDRAGEQTADHGTTIKTAWRAFDGAIIESVIMRYRDRTTICISSEAGCGMACPFCATGQGGLQRNLTASEIVWQVHDAARRLAAGEFKGGPGHINNIVFMGMGEPMANYKQVMAAVRQIHAPNPDGLGIGARGITISTVGMVPRMRQLADEGLPVTLALSLHAPDDQLRDEIVPLNKHFNVDAVLDAAWDYANVTKRRVSIEYILIKDINDQSWRADLLARRLKARGDWGWFHVNLIPLNPTPGSKWTASRPTDERAFVEHLEHAGVPVTVRDTRGSDIDGACGQLAANLDSRASERS